MMSRSDAKRFVSELVSRGYTPEKADVETFMGYMGDDGSYEIRGGRIHSPMFDKESFSFRELARELELDVICPPLF